MLLLAVFLLQLVIQVVSSVGAAAVNELLWNAFNRLPTPTAAAFRDAGRQRREVLRLRREMNATSPQDDFARWAKLRRQHDKAAAEHDKTAGSLKAFRARFDAFASTTRWLGTTGLRFALQFWFASAALFWIPSGWLPYYVEWLISFPKAPLGSVSIQCWWIACASVLSLAADAIVSLRILVSTPAAPDARITGNPRDLGSAAAGRDGHEL